MFCKYQLKDNLPETIIFCFRNDGNQSLYVGDEAESSYTTTKFDKRSKPRYTYEACCTICNTQKPISFTEHWLSHESQSYTKENDVYVCQIFDCFYVSPIQEEMLKHIFIQHLHRYSCHFCHFLTYSRQDYFQHRSTHYTYQCLECDLQSTKIFFVQDHEETPFRCTVCEFKTYHWFPYKKHVKWHSYPPGFIVQCQFCDFTTGDPAVLANHELDHCTKSIRCKLCEFTGTNIAELAQHCKDSHDTILEALNKLHKCKFCICKFISSVSKEKHEKLHLKRGASLKCCSNVKLIQCPYCDYLPKRGKLKSHIISKHAAALELDGYWFESASDEMVSTFKGLEASDTQECEENQVRYEADQPTYTEIATTYPEKVVIKDNIAEDEGTGDPEENSSNDTQIIWHCQLCPHVSEDKQDFNQHLTSMHDTSQKERKEKAKYSYDCTVCHFTTTSRVSHDSHITNCILKHKVAEHDSTAPKYTCPFCYYDTSSKEHYDVHCGQHTTFQCSKCTFESTKKLFVEDHIENPWGCSKCDFKTYHWLPLKSHIFSHNSYQTDALLKCNECDFQTRNVAALKNHRFTLLKCRICQFKTGCESALQNHYANHHNGTQPDDWNIRSNYMPYKCDLCECKFKRQAYLDKHRTLHSENGPFHLKCSQCHKNRTAAESRKEREQAEDKPDSWNECPYCGYEDDLRYKMIEHLSRIHRTELEAEGYRFDQTKENIPHTLSNDAVNMNHKEETESVYDAFQTNLIQEDVIDSTNTPIEQIMIKIEPVASVEQESPKYLTPKDNTVHSNRGIMYQDQAQTQTSQIFQKKTLSKNGEENTDTKTGNKTDRWSENRYHSYVDDVLQAQDHPPTGFIVDQDPEYIRKPSTNELNQGNETITYKEQQNIEKEVDTIEHNEETETEYDVFQTNVIEEEEEEVDNVHAPIERIIIKVEPVLSEQESPTYLTPKRNTLHLNSENMQQHQVQRQTKPEPGLTSELCPSYNLIDHKWHCPVCPYYAARKHLTEQHIDSIHSGGQNITWHCKICPYRTKTEDGLRDHVFLMHKIEYRPKIVPEEIPCRQPGCDFKAPSVDELSMHMARHLQTSMQEVMSYKCNKCSFRSVSKSIFRKHTKSCSVPIWYYCYHCNFRSETKKGIASHIDKKHHFRYINGYQCRRCGYSSKEKFWRKNHYKDCRSGWNVTD
nr:unnamed protein product [Callosobruchus analis]